MARNIPTQTENPKGLHQRYHIEKVNADGSTSEIDPEAEYFVLRLDENGKDPEHIRAGRIAINIYANEIRSHLPELADDLRKRYPLLPKAPYKREPLPDAGSMLNTTDKKSS